MDKNEKRLTTDISIYYGPYRLSISKRKLVRQNVQFIKESGVFRDFNYAYMGPIFPIRCTTCVICRLLNAVALKNRSPLSLITNQQDRLAGRKYFTTLDIAQKYYQVPMHPYIQILGKEQFSLLLYVYLRVPLELANLPAELRQHENGRKMLELISKAQPKFTFKKGQFLHAKIEY